MAEKQLKGLAWRSFTKKSELDPSETGASGEILRSRAMGGTVEIPGINKKSAGTQGKMRYTGN